MWGETRNLMLKLGLKNKIDITDEWGVGGIFMRENRLKDQRTLRTVGDAEEM